MSTIDLIRAQMQSKPLAPAIRCGSLKWTYGDLEHEVACLVARLRELGLEPGDRVAIVGHRSERMIVAEIASMWLGLPFVPVDRDQPSDRIHALLRGVRPSAIVDCDGDLEVEIEAPAVNLPQLPSAEGLGEPARIDGEHPVYLLYTSGTTGTPKAVVVPDRGLRNLVTGFLAPLFDENDVSTVGVISPFFFDASMKMIHGALGTGRCLSIITTDERDDFGELTRALHESRVDALDGTPTYLGAWMEYVGLRERPSLKCLLIGGERLGAELANRLTQVTGGQVYNVYGPTEATVDATVHRHQPDSQRVPIGRPIPGVDVRLMRGRHEVGVGQPGELLIGGAGVALGYFDDPKRTEEKFVIDPFGPGSGRFYRTGDMARRLPDGTIDYLGRADDQVKLRGHRIEPAEIEYALQVIPGVATAGVQLAEEPQPHLVAFVTADHPMDFAKVDAAMQQSLPDYMVPARYVQVDSLPLTRNGKLNRRALVAMAPTAPLSGETREARTPAEAALLQGLRTAMRLPEDTQLDLDSSLMSLGGDSITAILLVSAMSRMGHRLDVRQVLKATSMTQLSQWMAESEPSARPETDARGDVPATPAIHNLSGRGYRAPEHFHQSTTIPLTGSEAERLPDVLAQLLERHPILAAQFRDRTLLVPHGELPEVPITRCSFPDLDADEALPRVEAVIHSLLAEHDLAAGPQLMAVCWTVGEIPEETNLLLAAHHSVVDAISWATISDDLRGLFDDPDGMPDSPAWSFRAWAKRLTEFSASREARADLPYWDRVFRQVADCRVDDILPTPQSDAVSRAQRIRIPAAETIRRLHEERRDDTITAEGLILAGVASAAGHVWPLTNVPVLVESHGRPTDVPGLADVDVSGTVGWFTSVHPVVVPASGPSLLPSVRNALMQAPNEGLTAALLCPEQLRSGALAVVNHLGRVSSAAPLNPFGGMASSLNVDPQPMTIDSFIDGDEIVIDLNWREDLVDHPTAERFLAELAEAVAELGSGPLETGVVPTDLGADQLGLDELATLPSDAERAFPLTPMQEGLLFDHLSSTGDDTHDHIVQLVQDFDVPFDGERLRTALTATVAEIPALRTTIHWDRLTQPHQVVSSDPTPFLELHDLRSLGTSAAAAADAIARKALARPFRLDEPGLFRVDACAVGAATRLIITHHHVILDGWSIGMVLDRFTQHYHSGPDATLPPIPSLEPYVAWVRGHDREAFREHWAGVLDGFEYEPLQISGDPAMLKPDAGRSKLPAQRSTRTTRAGLLDHVHELLAPEGLSVAAALEAALAIVLARFRGRDDVAYGVVGSGRDVPVQDVDRMVGLLINTVPRRVRISPDATFLDVAHSIGAQTQSGDAAEHCHGSMSQIAAVAGQQGLVDVVFTFENYDTGENSASGPRPVLVEAFEQTSAPLTVTADVVDGELELTIIRDPRLLTAEDAARVVERIEAVLHAFTVAPSLPVPQLGPEPSQVPVRPQVGAPTATTLDGALRESFAMHRDRIAASDADERVTYRELEERATALAHALRRNGVRTGDTVAIVGGRSVGLVVATLATVLAGGAYVPLEGQTPKSRAATLTNIASARVIVCADPSGAELCAALAADGKVIVGVDAPIMGEALPSAATAPDSLVNIMYTSGTTGVPKGVMVPHRAILRLARDPELLPFSSEDVLLMTGSVAFDASTIELWATVLHGGHLVLPRHEDLLDPTSLTGLIREHGVTVLWLTVSLFNQLITMDVGMLDGVQRLYIGGEKVSADHVALLHGHNPNIRVFNGYGPTENTTFTTVHPIPRTTSPGERVPVGTPIAGTEVLILGSGDRRCDVGEVGELCAAGAGVALGYIGNEEATVAAFTGLEATGELLYRTGDRARWLADGTVDLLGRIADDQQVKVRGFRIELGEVEAAMLSIDGVHASVVRGFTDDSGVTNLIGYFVADDDIDVAAIRTGLAGRLAEHAVPGQLVRMEQLPLTRNGKVDLAALPQPQTVPTVADGAGRSAEHTPTLRSTLEAFAAALGHTVAPDTNFFEEGGDSIKAIRVIAEIRKRGFRASVGQVMRGMTPRRVAEQLTEEVGTTTAAVGDATGKVGRMPIVGEFFDWDLAQPAHFNHDFVINLDGASRADIRTVLAAVWEQHAALRSVVRDRHLYLRTLAEAELPLTEHVAADPAALDDLLRSTADEYHRMLDLTDGPLARFAIIRAGNRTRLLIVAHHLVVDGVTWSILSSDIVDGVRALQQGSSLSLPRATASLTEWATALERHMERRPAAERRYWDDVDREAAATAPVFPSSSGRQTHELTEIVDGLSPAALAADASAGYGANMEDVLLTALGRALHDLTGNAENSIQLEHHGRIEHPELPSIDRTAGWFTNMFPIVLQSHVSDRESLVAMKDRLRAVPDRGLAHMYWNAGATKPRSSVTFNYMGDLGEASPSSFGSTVFNQTGVSVAPENVFLPGLRFNVGVRDAVLQVSLSHDDSVIRSAEALELLARFTHHLRGLAAHLSGQPRRFRTAADFPALEAPTFKDLMTINALDQARGGKFQEVAGLSPLQEGMLVHSLGQNAEYVVQRTYRIETPLASRISESTLVAAANALAAEHSALRTNFLVHSLSRPAQVIIRDREIPVRWDDWRAEGPEAITMVDEAIRDEVDRGFDVERDPLVRIRLFQTATEEGERLQLCLTMHHLIADGWSLSTMVNSLVHHCRRLSSGHSASKVIEEAKQRGADSLQLTDHISWIQAQDRAAFAAHWSEALQGYDADARFLSAATNQPFPPAADEQHAGHRMQRSTGRLAARLLERYASEGITLSHLLHAAYGVVLAHESGSDDVMFGSIASGREHALEGLDEAVGLFITTVPFRVRMRPGQRVSDFVREVRDFALASAEYTYGSLSTIGDITGQREDIRTLLAFENYSFDDSAESFGMKFERGREETNYSVSFAATPSGEELDFTVLHDPKEYATSDADRLLARVKAVLEAFADHPEEFVQRLSSITPAERTLVLTEFNDTALTFPADETMSSAFHEAARSNPERVALIHGDREVSFGSLSGAVAALTSELLQAIAPGDRVGLLFDRGFNAEVARLAVLDLGACFVPLDVEAPPQRLAHIVEDADIRVLLTEPGKGMSQGAALRDSGVRTFDVNGWVSDSFAGGQEEYRAPAAPERMPSPEDPAYCIFTSGSTGRPKGVIIRHKGVANLRAHLVNEYAPTPEDRVLQFANSVFDASIWELTLSLLNGSAMVLVDASMIYETDELEREMERTGVTLGLLPPQYFLQLNSLPMRTVTTGGSASSVAVVELARKLGIGYVNAFGPTESTVLATGWRDPGFDRPLCGCVPIGVPVANHQVYVLANSGSPDRRLCGVGQIGELCVAGVGLAAGYVGLPDLTAEMFIPNPFGEGRLYRTGDQVRWLDDGNIEYLGRMADDQQVKIRSFRVELGEIEAAIRQLDGVRDVAVVAKDVTDAELIAYVVGKDIDPARIREDLLDCVPGYMVPAHVMSVPSLPLNRSGKLDRAQLPQPDEQPRVVIDTADLSSSEKEVLDAFAAVLGQQCQLDENFFELGGNSIKAIRVVSALRAEGYSIAVADVMGGMTARTIAARISRSSAPAVQRSAIQGAVPKSGMVDRFFGWELAVPEHFNQDLVLDITYDLAGMDAASAVRTVLDIIYEHHDVLRAVVREEALWINPPDGPDCPLLVETVEEDQLQRAVDRIAAGLHTSFDLEQGPLFTTALVSSPKSHRLVLVAHHLVIDIVSWYVIEDDIRLLLGQLANNRPLSLPARSATIREWAHQSMEFARKGLERDKAYWDAAQRGVQSDNLLIEQPNEEQSAPLVRRHVIGFEAVEALQRASAAPGGLTVEEVVVGGLGRAARATTGQSRLVIALESHGRVEHPELPDVSRTVGWLTTLSPIVLTLSDDVHEVLLEAKEAVRGVPDYGIAWQAVPEEIRGIPILLSLNYLGSSAEPTEQVNRWFNQHGPAANEANAYSSGVTVNASIERGHLVLIVAAEPGVADAEWLDTFAQHFHDELYRLVQALQEVEREYRTPSDLGGSEISLDELELLNDLFG